MIIAYVYRTDINPDGTRVYGYDVSEGVSRPWRGKLDKVPAGVKAYQLLRMVAEAVEKQEDESKVTG